MYMYMYMHNFSRYTWATRYIISVATGYIKRVIVHPAFLNASFKEAEKELAKMDLEEAIFRPSSKVSHSLV